VPIWITDPSTAPATSLRGRLRGIWSAVHPVASFSDGDTVSGTDDLSGKTFLAMKSVAYANPGDGVCFVETSDTTRNQLNRFMGFTKYTGTITGQVGSLITALDANPGDR